MSARPRPGEDGHTEWLLARLRPWLAAHPRGSREAFLAAERESAGGGIGARRGVVPAYATKRDVWCSWSALVAQAHGQVPQTVDVSGLDFDDDATQPGTPPYVRPVEPIAEPRVQQVEPRDLVELRKARARAAELERKLTETVEALHHADDRAGILDELRGAPEPQPILRRETSNRMREATAVVMASDWHLEEVVNPDAIEGRNAYSPAIARARVERMAEGILWLVAMHRERFAIRDLVLWLGGDLISGYLHDELEETNALSPIEATLFAHETIGGLIRTLLDKAGLERLVIPCNVGNHGRTTKKTRAKTRVQNSYEFLLYRHLQQSFASDPRAQFTIAGGAHVYLDVYGQTIRFHHGDDVSYGGGIGGITIPINKAIASWQKFRRADLTCIGHFHQLLHGGDFVVNGSLVGYNEFALRIKAPYEPPQQAFFLMDSRRGRCCATPLWVDEHEQHRKAV